MSLDTSIKRNGVNQREANEIYALYNHDPTVYMCKNYLITTLLSGGIECTYASRNSSTKRTALPGFQAVLDRHWISFTRDMLDWFFMFGYCPFAVATTRNSEKKPVHIPVVPQFGSGTFEVRENTASYEQTIHWIPTSNVQESAEQDDTNVSILMCDDGMPNVNDGAHKSRVAKLLPQYRWIQRMKSYAIKAEHIRSHPPIITQDSPDKRPVNETLSDETFADPADLFREKEDRTYKKNASSMNAMYNQQRMASDLNQGRPTVIQNGFPHDGTQLELTQSYYDNMFHIPNGTQLAGAAPMPQSRADLVEMDRQRMDVTCGTFGVPKSLIMADRGRSNAAGASEVEYRMLMQTVDGLCAVVTRALHEVYTSIYKEDEQSDHSNVKFSLPFMPLTSIENITKLYQEGIITKQTEGEYLLRACGLPLVDLDVTESRSRSQSRSQSLRKSRSRSRSRGKDGDIDAEDSSVD